MTAPSEFEDENAEEPILFDALTLAYTTVPSSRLQGEAVSTLIGITQQLLTKTAADEPSQLASDENSESDCKISIVYDVISSPPL